MPQPRLKTTCGFAIAVKHTVLCWPFFGHMEFKHGFYMYRVFISAPGDLDADRDDCRAAIAEVNEKQAMPRRMLLVSVGLQSDEQILGYRAAVAGNVRAATYYIQIFADDWGP